LARAGDDPVAGAAQLACTTLYPQTMQWYIPDQTTRIARADKFIKLIVRAGERLVKYLYFATVDSLSGDYEDCTVSFTTCGRSFYDKYYHRHLSFLATGLSVSRKQWLLAIFNSSRTVRRPGLNSAVLRGWYQR
jgi:hypothetical protein